MIKKRISETRFSKIFKEFLENEKTGGIILVAVTIISLILANTSWHDAYKSIWGFPVANHNLEHWINDGLMTVFFLLIGLEIKREIYKGELSNIKNASLPVFGALGGMIVPALLYTAFNIGKITQSGTGIPMATDIAFSIGILSLLGNKVPASLKIFLTALAIIDDLGAIIVIALFYTSDLSVLNLLIALGIFGILLLFNYFKFKKLFIYLIGGTIMWYFMLHSGVHATITGVLLAFAIPFVDGSKKSPSSILEHALQKPVPFIILPIFAMANTCIVIEPNWFASLTHDNSIGIMTGLIFGKPIGIFLFAFASVALGWSALPKDLKWTNIIGAGIIAGIGFTMSIFITLLAFDDPHLVAGSKIAILLASLTAGIIGYIYLKLNLKNKK
ncbi:MAG TPA: Na+/H+ antiporter NhaA [Bacteroidales bacterium]|nr:Na+/H+ antiporter NhaA [Bacteroidales bacterium]